MPLSLRKRQRKTQISPKKENLVEVNDSKSSTISMEIRSCFVCGKDTSVFCENLFKINTKHSDTPVLKYIDKFLGYTLIKDESFEKLIICKSCMTKIDEFDKAYKTAKLVQNELKELLHMSVKTIKQNSLQNDENDKVIYPLSSSIQNIQSDPTSYDELQNKDIKLEIEILDTDENFEEILEETYNYDIDDTKIEILDEYQMVEERIDDMYKDSNSDEAFFETCISENDEIQFKEEFDFGDSITMICDICNTSFKSLSEMDHHSKYVHGKIGKKTPKPIKSKDSVTAQRKPFVDHIRTKKSEPTKKCKICQSKFYTKEEVKEHVDTVHEFDDQRCEQCGIVCSGKANLEEHMELHATRQPLECVICSKVVKRLSFLRQHMLIHTGEKCYQCDLCGKQFIHHSSMRMHMRMHRDIRDSECEICGHKSRSKSHLNKHMLTHTGEKKWQCPICLNRFASGGNMRAHMNIHLGIASRKKHICMMCNQTFPSMTKLTAHQALAHDTANQGGDLVEVV